MINNCSSIIENIKPVCFSAKKLRLNCEPFPNPIIPSVATLD